MSFGEAILRSSPLKGMERSMPSFTSFVRTAPPYSGSDEDKPLPPIPKAIDRSPPAQSPSPIPPLSSRTGSDNSWKAPVEWEDPSTPTEELRTSPGSTNRIYAPLLPEPSPGVFDTQAESTPWPLNISSLQQSRLQSIGEATDEAPSPPTRSDLRGLPSKLPSTVSESDVSE